MRSDPSIGFLRYDQDADYRSGMNNQLNNLQWLLREAFLCGRLAVLPALRLLPYHNFDGLDGCGQWDTYFDLEASRLVDHAGGLHPLPIARELPRRPLRTLTLARRSRMPAHAREFELVIRPVRDFVVLRDLPYARWRRVFGDVVAGTTRIGFAMQPSSRVRELAEPVTRAIVSEHGSYAAVHVRRRDLTRTWPVLGRRTEPGSVRARLRRLGIRDGDPVFFLSNERDPEYWRSLGRFYNVIRHTDFPDLAALVDGEGSMAVDNYLLYEVEKAIMRRAAIRVESIPGPNYAPSHATLVSRHEWIMANLLPRLRRAARRSKRHLRDRLRIAPPRRHRPATGPLPVRKVPVDGAGKTVAERHPRAEAESP